MAIFARMPISAITVKMMSHRKLHSYRKVSLSGSEPSFISLLIAIFEMMVFTMEFASEVQEIERGMNQKVVRMDTQIKKAIVSRMFTTEATERIAGSVLDEPVKWLAA